MATPAPTSYTLCPVMSPVQYKVPWTGAGRDTHSPAFYGSAWNQQITPDSAVGIAMRGYCVQSCGHLLAAAELVTHSAGMGAETQDTTTWVSVLVLSLTSRSSLSHRLRLEWTQRLESRNRMLQCPQETPTLFLPSIVPENAPDKAAT